MFMETLRSAPRAFKVLVASALIENIGFGLIFPYLTIYMVEDLGISEPLAGVALAGYTMSGIPAMVLGGMLADRIGRRPVLLMSLGLMSITMALYFFASDFLTLFIIILADAFVGTLYMPAANAMIADVIPSKDRPAAYSTLRIAWNTGLFVGPAIGMMIVSAWSIRELFLFGSAIMGGAFVMNIFFIPETKPATVLSEEITFRKMMAVSGNRSFLVLCALTGTLWFFISQWMSVLQRHRGGAVLGERAHGGLTPALGHVQDGEIQAFRGHVVRAGRGSARFLGLVLRWRPPRGARVHSDHDFWRDSLHVHCRCNHRRHVA
jgi:MFS family permease